MTIFSRISLFFFGLSILVLQATAELEAIFYDFFDQDFDPNEERLRRKQNRERRVSRAPNSYLKKTKLKRLINLKESELNTDWANQRIGLKKALQNFKPKRKVSIAVIDTGVDFKNASIRKHLFKNQGELGLDSKGRNKSTNGIDDDANGYIDDVSGWDFANNDSKPQDTNGHGTHISGILLDGLEKYESIEIVPIKFFNENASDDENIKNSIKAFRYAIDQGVDIINYSAGGSRPSDLERAVLNKAEENGILVVAAAGNQGLNTDTMPYFPAGYDNNNIISVGGIDQKGRKVASSNYGLQSVDLFAPGKSIQSIGLSNTTKKLTGTSQATAFVTKVAALKLASLDRNPGPSKIKSLIIDRAKTRQELRSYSQQGLEIDADAIMQVVIPVPNVETISITELN